MTGSNAAPDGDAHVGLPVYKTARRATCFGAQQRRWRPFSRSLKGGFTPCASAGSERGPGPDEGKAP